MSTIWKNGKYQPLIRYVTNKDFKLLSNLVNIINGDSNTKGSFRKTIKDLIGGAPEAYDTLKEIADKLKSDDDLHKALNDAIILKASSDALNEEVTRAKNQEAYIQNIVNTKADTTTLTSLEEKVTANTTAIESKQPKGNYLTEHQSLEEYAKKTEIPTVPTAVSQLTNDSNFITAADIDLTQYATTEALTTITTNLDNEITRASSEEQKLKKLISDLDTAKSLQIETSTADNTTTYSFKQNNRVLQNIKVVNPVVKNNTLYL